MCGRYASAEDPASLKLFFETTAGDVEVLPPNYNVAPTQPVYVVDELSGARQLRVVKWGLVPGWAKDDSMAGRLINARADTVAEKPSFRTAFAKTRCLVPASGWYEWRTINAEPKVKQPYYLHSAAGGPVAMAGLLEAWRNPATGEWLRTMAVITTDACRELEEIHDRMPALIGRDQWQIWLDPATPAAQLHELLHPAAPGEVAVYEVSPRVNSIRNNGADLIAPV